MGDEEENEFSKYVYFVIPDDNVDLKEVYQELNNIPIRHYFA